MARVVLPGALAQLAGVQTIDDVEGATVRAILRNVSARYPALEAHLEEGFAVAIDGEIHQDAWFSAVPPDAEVCLLPKIAGG